MLDKWLGKLFHRRNGQEVNQVDSESQDLKRRSEELRRGADTILRKFGIVKADNEQDQQRIDALCEATFKRTSRFSFQSRTPDDMQGLFGSINYKEDLPVVRRAIIRHYVSDPSLASIDPFGNTAAHLQESTRQRFAADREIYELFEALHCELRKYEPRIIDTRPFPERSRSECFHEVSRLLGTTEKAAARCFDRLNWRALKKDRDAEIERALYPELPEVTTWGDPRRSANNQQEYERNKRQLRNYETAKARADAGMRETILRFQVLHGELMAYQMKQIAKANERRQIEQRIERLQRVRAAM